MISVECDLHGWWTLIIKSNLAYIVCVVCVCVFRIYSGSSVRKSKVYLDKIWLFINLHINHVRLCVCECDLPVFLFSFGLLQRGASFVVLVYSNKSIHINFYIEWMTCFLLFKCRFVRAIYYIIKIEMYVNTPQSMHSPFTALLLEIMCNQFTGLIKIHPQTSKYSAKFDLIEIIIAFESITSIGHRVVFVNTKKYSSCLFSPFAFQCDVHLIR